jgi:hypothetical protein
MINLGSDIFLFKSIFPIELINEFKSIRSSDNNERINIHDVDFKLFLKFNDWFKKVDIQIMDEYLSVYDIENDIGLNATQDTLNNIKEFCKAKWRDVYTLRYTPNHSNLDIKNVHFDFTNITTVICLDDRYEGGELVFPRQDISVKLFEGDCIVFPGDLRYPHYAKKVTSGIREVLVGQSLTLKQDHRIEYE